MAAPPQRQTISFVIRLWHEPGADPAQWRGQIEHVGSGDTAHFQFSNGLWEFLRQHAEFLTLPQTKDRHTESDIQP